MLRLRRVVALTLLLAAAILATLFAIRPRRETRPSDADSPVAFGADAPSMEAGRSAWALAPDAPLPEGLATILSAFPRGDIMELVPGNLGMTFPIGAIPPSSPRPLEQWLREVLDAAAGEDGKSEELEIAFIVDMSFHADVAQAAQELELALAKNRPNLARGRFGLVVTGNRDGQWSARIDAPLTHDSYDIQRALRKVEYEQPWARRTGLGASWVGLVAVTRFDWRSRHPRIVLLTDDRQTGNELAEVREQKTHESLERPEPLVSEWAHRFNATIHAARCRYTDEDNQEYFAKLQSGVVPQQVFALDMVAKLFDGRRVEVAKPSDLVAAVEETLARIARTPQPPDSTRTGLSGRLDPEHATGVTCPRSSPRRADSFVGTPGNRLALIQYGKGEPSIVVNLTAKSEPSPTPSPTFGPPEGKRRARRLLPALNLASRSLSGGRLGCRSSCSLRRRLRFGPGSRAPSTT